jgi:hypothetical protein
MDLIFLVNLVIKIEHNNLLAVTKLPVEILTFYTPNH